VHGCVAVEFGRGELCFCVSCGCSAKFEADVRFLGFSEEIDVGVGDCGVGKGLRPAYDQVLALGCGGAEDSLGVVDRDAEKHIVKYLGDDLGRLPVVVVRMRLYDR